MEAEKAVTKATADENARMQGLVDAANVERDENFQMYLKENKVTLILTF